MGGSGRFRREPAARAARLIGKPAGPNTPNRIS
jgi:hypothetical protein